MRLHLGTVALLAIAVVLPLSVVMLVLQIQSVGLDGIGDPLAGFDEDAGTDITLTVVGFLVGSLQVTLMAGAVAPLVTGSAGSEPSASLLAGRLLRRLPAVLAGWILVKFVEVIGLFGVGIGAAVVMVFSVLTTPVIVTLCANPFRALGLSFRLVGRAFGRTVGVVALMVVVDNLIRLSFIAVPAVLTAWSGWSAGALMVAVLSVVADLLSASFVALATVTHFQDLRVRVDDHDLERRFESIGVDW